MAGPPTLAAARRLGPPMLPDLSFADAPLEAAFMRHHRRGKRAIVFKFALYRAAALLFLSLRVLAARDVPASLMFALASAASFVPLLAVQDRSASCGAQAAVMLVDVMQAVFGCINRHHISPSRRAITPLGSLAHLVHASGVLWPHLYTSFSPLPFKRQLVGQAVVTAVLLAFNRVVCTSSLGLRVGYRTAQRLLHVTLCPLLAALGGAATQHCSGPQQASLEADMQLCQEGQVAMLLLPAFAAAMWGLYSSERRLRLDFLRELAAELSRLPPPQQQQQQQRPGASRHHGEEPPPTSDELAAELAALRPLPHDVARLAADASLAPCLPDFLLHFALPALAALWSYARWPLFGLPDGHAAPPA